MPTILRTIALVLLCGALCTSPIDARGRHDREPRQSEHRAPKTPDKPRTPGKHGRQDQRRPDRPGTPGRHGNPGNYGRPGKHGNQRNPEHFGQKPHHDNRHGHAPRPPHGYDHRPHHGGGYSYGHHHVHYGRPHRPHMPPPRPYYRPEPPPRHWHPHVWRPFRTILGVTLGSAINISINALLNSGYTVSGYDNDIVYLSDVPMLNFSWPAANLYYGNGGLYGSEFVYSTPGCNMGRYNAVFSSLSGVYGAPYQVQMLAGGGRRATWWGTDGQYITLTFAGNYASAGGLRYYTTLSFGR